MTLGCNVPAQLHADNSVKTGQLSVNTEESTYISVVGQEKDDVIRSYDTLTCRPCHYSDKLYHAGHISLCSELRNVVAFSPRESFRLY
jgi:hypothetical protein